MRKARMQKGITLIALIITIIILLILAVVTIGSIKNSNIITYAQNASIDYNAEKDKEESTIAGYKSLIESNLPGKSSDLNGIPATTIAEAQLDSMLTKTVNSEIEDKYNNKIVVPAGFKIFVDEDNTGYTVDDIDVTKGIVIQDVEGNEFVWIPVGENITNDKKEETITLSRYTFNSSTGAATLKGNSVIDGYYQEEPTSSYNNARAKNITEFLNSVNKNKGYYIARYEAGVTGYDQANIKDSNSKKEENWTGYVAEEGKELELVSKSEQKVWDFVTQNKASELCQNMYEENNNYTSDLINSYAWDTAIVFIQTFGKESDAGEYSKLNKSTGWRKTGMNNDKYCNIHDMSGNAFEWSTETYTTFTNPCSHRGGYFDSVFKSPSLTTSTRWYYSIDTVYEGLTFRPILYL